MTPSLQFTTLARQDLRHLKAYITQHDPSAAHRLTDKIAQTCVRLASMPHTGRARPELADAMRCFPVNPYMIYYRKTPEGLQVLRVIHQARNLASTAFPLH